MRWGNHVDLGHMSGPPSILGTVGGPKTGLFGGLYTAGSPTIVIKITHA